MKEIGKTTIKVLLAVVNAYYDEQNGYSHCSVAEINKKYGIAKNSMPKMFQQLCEEGWIEDCTVSGYYKRFKILKPYPCPDFIEMTELSNPQKNFLLKCLEQGVTENMSKKELARRIFNNENNNNISRSLTNIQEACGYSAFNILNSIEFISGLVPSDAEYTEFGYRTILNKKEYTISETEDDKLVNHLYSKSKQRYKMATNISEYTLTPEYIKELLISQDYKDFYTGLIPEDKMSYSIDRIDSSKGYIQGNVVITTTKINLMKGTMSTEEFKKTIEELYNNINNF